MEVVILQDANEIGGIGADAITALLRRSPAAVLGLATGSSPLAIYDELARALRRRRGVLRVRPAASPSMSTSGCPLTTRSATAT